MINNKKIYFVIFFLSGFSGLIYESIWSHYLKLFLGHAAYAQTLVLAIFMGGMAIGSWICSIKGKRWKNLILAYALVEGIIGVIALLFHEVFVSILDISYQNIMPALGTSYVVNTYKWIISALIITPQSILLGMTFPLMSAGVIRLFPVRPGHTVSMLYFTNSIGAAIGVIASGFVFIAWIGLPGTIRLAGLINILIALFVWQLIKHKLENNSPAVQESASTNSTTNRFYYRLLLIAFFTGMASFIYEVSWIRMLSLVLGSSTHAFELMLSAFILGLALGGLWIRNRIDKISNSVRFLAIVQLAMGILALSTLPFYNWTFDAMQWIVNTLEKTDTGFLMFNISSHAIATAVMLPTTFCAGMTLPLITFTLLQRGDGEKSIGAVYAANTVGAICGVFFAIHIGMPLLGLKYTLWSGAAIDIFLGISLLLYLKTAPAWKNIIIPTGVGLCGLLIALTLFDLDIYKMGSGVYRDGSLYKSGEIDILYHKDGKSASVDLHQTNDGYVAIRTNGKVDATIKMFGDVDMSVDEPTMVLAAALPLSYNPSAKRAAVIGMGSGLSTHALLSADSLDAVDTVEIEPAIVEAAHGFRPRVELAYTDPRSHIYIEDAKTYFSTHNKRYDIIISEPSNPWVSGTASLFTREFYKVVKNYLNDDAILVQWVQLYEFNTELVATIVKALSREFSDYTLYTPADFDLLIVAKKQGTLSTPSSSIFSQPNLAKELNMIGIQHLGDLQARRIGDRAQLEPLFMSYNIPGNSDYYPVLDLHAAKARFFNAKASGLVALTYQPVPVIRALEQKQRPEFNSISATTTPTIAKFYRISGAVYQTFQYSTPLPEFVPDKYSILFNNLLNITMRCHTIDIGGWIDYMLELNSVTVPFLSRNQLIIFWQKISSGKCFNQLPDQYKDWFELMISVSSYDAEKMSGIARWLLLHNVATNARQYLFLVEVAMLGDVLLNRGNEALNIFSEHKAKFNSLESDKDLTLRMLLSHAKNQPGRPDNL